MRLTEALSGSLQALEMKIIKYGADSVLSLSESLLISDDKVFVATSARMARALAEAQLYRQIPGGMAIVFDGSVGTPPKELVGVIKAETQDGFRRTEAKRNTKIELLKGIFLTPATRMYKIGMFVRDRGSATLPDGWLAYVFDSNLSAIKREGAAQYFYEGFLGCELPEHGAYETAKFFDATKDFIKASSYEPEKKRNLIDSLYVFVRDETSPTFSASEFASRFLENENQGSFLKFIERKHVPTRTIVRDISGMGTRLRKRRFHFGADIEFSVSVEALNSDVSIEEIEPISPHKSATKWTKITVKRQMSGEK